MAAALALLHAAPSGVTLYAFDRNENKFTSKGSVGCAIVGNAKTNQYQILCYSDSKAPICTASITAANDFRYNVSQGPGYGSFTADNKAVWSVSFRSDQEAADFATQVGLTYWACQGKPPNNVVHYDLTPGVGNQGVSNGDFVAIRYTGWYVKENDRGLPCLGDTFEGSRGNEKTKLQLGQGTLCQGLETGLLGMKKEGKRVVVLPPARSDSPPQACVYLVELCRVKYESHSATPSLPLPFTNPNASDVDEISNSSFGSIEPSKRDVLKRLSAKGSQPLFPGMDINLSSQAAGRAQSPSHAVEPPTLSSTAQPVPNPSMVAPPLPPQSVQHQPPPSIAAVATSSNQSPPPPQVISATQYAAAPPPVRNVADLTFEEFFKLKQQQAQQPVAAITMNPSPQPPLQPPIQLPPEPALQSTTVALHPLLQQQQQLQQLLLAQQQLQQFQQLGLLGAPHPPPTPPAPSPPATAVDPAISTLATQQKQIASNVDTVLERLSALSMKFENLEAHSIFKESGKAALSGIALTTSISRIVSENEQMRSDLSEKDNKIISLKDKLNEMRKKNETYVHEVQQLLEEKKSIAEQANEGRLDLEKEVGRLREQLARANVERDDSARHLVTVKKLLELSDEELQKSKSRLEILESSSQADQERVQELQKALREEKSNRKAAQDRCSQLRDELQEEQAAHIRTQQAVEERKKKAEAEREALKRQLEEERAAANNELARLRQEMSESLSDRDKRVDADKQRWLNEGMRKGHQEGLEEGRRIAEGALKATIDTLNSKLDIQHEEMDALRATAAVMQESLEGTKAALVETRQKLQRSESECAKRDAEVGHLTASMQAKIKSIMSTVYFRMDRHLRKGKQKQLRPKDTLALLMSCIKEVTLQMMAGQLDHDDEEDEYEEQEEQEDEQSPRPPLKMVQVLEPIFSSRDSEYDAMSQGGFSLGDCMSVDVEIASSIGGISVSEVEALDDNAEDTVVPCIPDIAPPVVHAPVHVVSGTFSEGPSEIEAEASETAPSILSSEVFDAEDPPRRRSSQRRVSTGEDSVDTAPDSLDNAPRGKGIFEDSSEDEGLNHMPGLPNPVAKTNGIIHQQLDNAVPRDATSSSFSVGSFASQEPVPPGSEATGASGSAPPAGEGSSGKEEINGGDVNQEANAEEAHAIAEEAHATAHTEPEHQSEAVVPDNSEEVQQDGTTDASVPQVHEEVSEVVTGHHDLDHPSDATPVAETEPSSAISSEPCQTEDIPAVDEAQDAQTTAEPSPSPPATVTTKARDLFADSDEEEEESQGPPPTTSTAAAAPAAPAPASRMRLFDSDDEASSPEPPPTASPPAASAPQAPAATSTVSNLFGDDDSDDDDFIASIAASKASTDPKGVDAPAKKTIPLFPDSDDEDS